MAADAPAASKENKKQKKILKILVIIGGLFFIGITSLLGLLIGVAMIEFNGYNIESFIAAGGCIVGSLSLGIVLQIIAKKDLAHQKANQIKRVTIARKIHPRDRTKIVTATRVSKQKLLVC